MTSERTADADVETVREECAKLISARVDPLLESGSLPPMWPWWLPLVDAISDRLVARNQQLQEALTDAVRAYDSLLQAERDDAKMGYPLPGDSCLAAAMGLGADETFEMARAALASVRARTPARDGAAT